MGFLRRPLQALQPPSDQDKQTAKTAVQAESAAAVKRLPPPTFVEQLPLPDIAPSAITPFVPDPQVNLVRGDEVVTLSNSALRSSGVFQTALTNSPTLAKSYYKLEAATLQRQKVELQLEAEHIKATQNAQNGMQPNSQAALTNSIMSLETARSIVVTEQVAAEAEFERNLWSQGLNGAKVGSVTTMDRSDATGPERFIMVKAMGNSPSNNLGYTRTQVYNTGEFGFTTVPSEYLLPLPTEPNDIFYNKLRAYDTQRAPDGVMIPLMTDETKNPIFQVLTAAQGFAYYDTGFVNTKVPGGNFSEGIAFDGDHRAGQSWVFGGRDVKITDLANAEVAANAQIMDVGGGNSLQFFTVANNDFNNDQFEFSSFGARAYNREIGSVIEGWALDVALKQTIFGELSASPAGLVGGRNLVGTINPIREIPQLAVHAPISDYLFWNVAIEDPDHDQTDVAYLGVAPPAFTRLNRWPTFATNITIKDAQAVNLLHLGALARSNGFEQDATSDEFFATGWGLSAIAEFLRNRTMYYAGVAGGNGVGRYVVGVPNSAVADPTTGSIEALSGIGAFVGTQTWIHNACNERVAMVGAAYGYSSMEDPHIATFDANERLHQAWINCTRFLGDQFAIGLEYQYGSREVMSGNSGEDHRLMMVFSVISKGTEDSTKQQKSVAAAATPVTGAGGLDADRPLSVTAGDAVQTTEATINGRSVDDVIRQNQRGGPAFQQSL